MKILLVTANFSAPGINTWLLDDLVAALVDAGHEVDVVVHSPTAPRSRGITVSEDERVRVFSVGASAAPVGPVDKLRSYLATGWRLHTSGWRFVKSSSYDLCVYTSIGAFTYGFPGRVRRASIAKRLLFVMWDFFPIHQLEIGRITLGAAHRPLRRLERAAISPADVIATMSPANEAFMRAYHPGLKGDYIVIPPWAADNPMAPSDKYDRFTVMFGGQLAKGRGVDTLLTAARLLEDDGADVHIIIAGGGPDESTLQEMAKELGVTNVTFAGQLDRAEYRATLGRVHVGVAVTVPGVSVPSFPSKIVEYCANSLPVIVSVEPSSDAGHLVETHGAGLVTPAGNARQLADAISVLAAEHGADTLSARGSAARNLFENEFAVRVAAARIVEA